MLCLKILAGIGVIMTIINENEVLECMNDESKRILFPQLLRIQ